MANTTELKKRYKITLNRRYAGGEVRTLVEYTEAINEQKARTSFQRKKSSRNSMIYGVSYMAVAQAKIEELGLTYEAELQAKSKGIVELLKIELESLRVQYVQKCMDWAKREVARKIEIVEDFEAFCEEHRAAYYNNQLSIADKLRFESKRSQAAKISLKDCNEKLMVEQAEKRANKHYEQSLIKLAGRIAEKGLNTSNLKAITSHIGVNIETTLTDGEKTVSAWTIIASGPIQRPHYRYLIK